MKLLRLVAFTVPALVACNAVIGLSDYKQGECSGGGSCFDSSIDRSDASDASTDVALVDATGTSPVSWARWKMPNYPQADASNVQRYDPTPDGGLREGVSGLTWQNQIDATPKTWEAAQKACSNGWRLPTRIELVSLLDLSVKDGKLDQKFTGRVAGTFWTSSEVRPIPTGQRWAVDFVEGRVTKLPENTTGYVRCILAK